MLFILNTHYEFISRTRLLLMYIKGRADVQMAVLLADSIILYIVIYNIMRIKIIMQI